MSDVERYLDSEGKFAWRVKKQVDDVVEEVKEIPAEVTEAEVKAEAESDKPKKRRRK